MLRRHFSALLIGCSAFALTGVDVFAQEQRPGGGRGRGGGPIVLKADDVAAFSEPPAGFDKKRDGVAAGKLEMVSYESKSVGTTRKMNV